jgi:hypothetical protein
VRAAGVAQRHALGHDRVNRPIAEQLDQRPEVLTEPIRVAGSTTRKTRWVMTAYGKHLMALAKLLDPVDEDPAPGARATPKARRRRSPRTT